MVSDNLLSHDDNKAIPSLILIKYHRMGFKLVPLGEDSKTPTVSSTNDIYSDPNYWTEDKLIEGCSKFSNIATTFGITYYNESEANENNKFYLHCLDIDSDNVLGILFDLLQELKSKTFVIKTKKDCGYHVYWLSHKQHSPIGTSKCKRGYEFEIKSDNSLGLCTLPPSQHRDDRHFKYKNIGLEDKIAIDDELYEKLLLLLSDQCLTGNSNNNHDEEENRSEDGSYNSSNGKSKSSSAVYKNLTDTKIEQVISKIKGAYRKGYRDPIVFGLSGLLFKNKIALQSAKDLIGKLCDVTHDEEKSSRLEVVHNTYVKGLEGTEIKGATQLLETFTVIHDGDEVSIPSYIYDYCAELFFLPPNDNKILHHRYITYNQKLKGYPGGFKKEDFSKFNLKAWAKIPISSNEILNMSIYLSKNNEIEDFTMQYRFVFDKRDLANQALKIAIPLKEGYTQNDIHTLNIRTDYGHKNIERKIKHTNIDLFDIFNNKINANDDKSFIKQNFEISSYESAIHYTFMQAEKINLRIGPQYWLSPFGINENRVDITHKLWQESRLSIPLCVLSKNIYVRIIEQTYNNKRQILDHEFQEILQNEIALSKKAENENSDSMILHQLNQSTDKYFLPFHFSMPEESFRYGSFKYDEDGHKQTEDRFEDMGIVSEQSNGIDKTINYNPHETPL
jgi:hypothetical protein